MFEYPAGVENITDTDWPPQGPGSQVNFDKPITVHYEVFQARTGGPRTDGSFVVPAGQASATGSIAVPHTPGRVWTVEVTRLPANGHVRVRVNP